MADTTRRPITKEERDYWIEQLSAGAEGNQAHALIRYELALRAAELENRELQGQVELLEKGKHAILCEICDSDKYLAVGVCVSCWNESQRQLTAHREAMALYEAVERKYEAEEFRGIPERSAGNVCAACNHHGHVPGGCSKCGCGARVMPRIVVLCGSTRFWETFAKEGLRLTLEGKIVLSIGIAAPDSVVLAHPDTDEGKQQKAKLDELHLRKIDLADEVLVLNVGGYIGDSTRREIEYAQTLGKPIRYLEV